MAFDMEPVQTSLATALRSLREAGPNQKKLLDSVKAVVTAANEMNRLSLQTARGLPADTRSGIEVRTIFKRNLCKTANAIS